MKYEKILTKLNKKALDNGDIPVSAIIVKDNKIISKAYNMKYKNNNPLDHAEVLAIKKACKKLKTTNLIDCELIVTLKPCGMCKEIIKESRIKKVHYFVDNFKVINDNTKYIKMKCENDYFSKELSEFFKDKR